MNSSDETCSHFEARMQAAQAYWKSHGGTMTSVRKIVCRKAFSATETFDAEQLLQWAREEDKLISLSTVYRTLNGLVEAGLLLAIDGLEGKARYDLVRAQTNASSHVVCQDCGGVIPLENPCLSLREGAIAHNQGFSPKKISLRYEATCDQFSQTGQCDRQHTKRTGPDSSPPPASNT